MGEQLMTIMLNGSDLTVTLPDRPRLGAQVDHAAVARYASGT
jgi:hypothetical protein